MLGYEIRRGVVGVFFLTIVLSGMGNAVLASDNAQPERSIIAPKEDGGALLLVRAWDPKTGELVGWLPMHRVAMTFQQIGPVAPGFDLNEAIVVNLPHRPSREPEEVRIAPEFVTFQGQRYLPAQHDPNIVRIKKCVFYVKAIVFGESKWRRATAVREEK